LIAVGFVSSFVVAKALFTLAFAGARTRRELRAEVEHSLELNSGLWTRRPANANGAAESSGRLDELELRERDGARSDVGGDTADAERALARDLLTWHQRFERGTADPVADLWSRWVSLPESPGKARLAETLRWLTLLVGELEGKRGLTSFTRPDRLSLADARSLAVILMKDRGLLDALVALGLIAMLDLLRLDLAALVAIYGPR